MKDTGRQGERPRLSDTEAVRQVRSVLKHYKMPCPDGASGWHYFDCYHTERHKGGSDRTFNVNFTTGQWKCHSTRCDIKGSKGGYSLVGFFEKLNFDLQADRRIAIDKMVELGLWDAAGDPPTPEQRAEAARRDAAERQAYQIERQRQLASIAAMRKRLLDVDLPVPPFESYKRDADLAEIEALIAAGYWFLPCDPDTKLPAKTLKAGKHYRYLWKDHATQDIDLIKRWLANGCRLGIFCGKSGVVVVDIDYKNFPLGPHDNGAKEFYAGWTKKRLQEAHAWQSAITATLLVASGCNYACTPGGGFHIFFADPEGKFTNTPLNTIAGSVFEFGVGWCEIKAGAGYVVAYRRYGDGRLRPLPDIVKTATHIKE